MFIAKALGSRKILTAAIAAKNANSAKKSFIMLVSFVHFCDLCGRKLFILCVSAPCGSPSLSKHLNHYSIVGPVQAND